jgi:DNA sulfur modification protein DndB
MDARFIINDGQHRRAAIEMALRESPSLGDESIAVVFFVDLGLERCQQMFADLNRHAVRPSRSLGVLYDHRDDLSRLTKLVVLRSEFFRDIVEMERSTLSPRSRKLFTLSALYNGTNALLDQMQIPDLQAGSQIAIEFWEAVAKFFPEWQLVRDRRMVAGDVRQDFIHSHGIVLHALGISGNVLLHQHPSAWKTRLKGLKKIDWSRNNAKLWEGRAMIGGQVSKAAKNVVLTTNIIKKSLGLELTPEESRIEEARQRSNDGSR